MTQPRLETVTVTPIQQNCSLLWDPGTGEGVVVDPGGDVPRILERVLHNAIDVKAILLTHGHLDHAGGADALRAALNAGRDPAQAVPMIGPDARDRFLLQGISAQARAYGMAGMEDAHPDRFLADGEVLNLLGRRFEVMLVPGHTPGHVVFFDREAGLLLAGDTLFAGSVGRTDFEYGDGPLLIRGIRQRLLGLGDEVVVQPGHGPATTIGDERRRNPFLRGAA